MLTETQLIALLDASETRLIERKVSRPNGAEMRKTLVAFANTVSEGENGVIFIGIADNGRRIGVDDADGIQREIRRVAENECYPPVRCEPVVIQNSGVEIVAIIIPPSTNRPHFSGHAYVRRGSESVNASIELFDEMVASRNDKARKLLAQKGKLISARFTGNTKLDRDPQYAGGPPRKWRDYKIEHCDAHYVRFVDVIFQLIYTPSLEHVAIEFDSQQHRLQLVVTEI